MKTSILSMRISHLPSNQMPRILLLSMRIPLTRFVLYRKNNHTTKPKHINMFNKNYKTLNLIKQPAADYFPPFWLETKVYKKECSCRFRKWSRRVGLLFEEWCLVVSYCCWFEGFLLVCFCWNDGWTWVFLFEGFGYCSGVVVAWYITSSKWCFVDNQLVAIKLLWS